MAQIGLDGLGPRFLFVFPSSLNLRMQRKKVENTTSIGFSEQKADHLEEAEGKQKLKAAHGRASGFFS